MKVELIDYMGDDLAVVNAARVSFDKESEWDWSKGDENGASFELSDKDAKLIHYLVEHSHWSPFSHCVAKFRVKAPIFVARQLAKHQVGGSWNEVSRRYVDSEPEFYVPEKWRKRAENVKQGSTDAAVDLRQHRAFNGVHVSDHSDSWDDYRLDELEDEHRERSLILYNSMLKAGVCPEQARMVLPQSMMTEWQWTGSLAFWARVYKLRMDEHAQAECKEILEPIGKEMERLFPVSWKALIG